MKPQIKLAETQTPDGGRLVLYVHDGEYRILLNGRELMHSFTTASEVEMGERVAERFSGLSSPRYLIGGLGLGFTLRAVLERLPPDGRVEVAELLPEVVAWNRAFMWDLNGALLEDPRVTVYEGDVGRLLAEAGPASYDGILLDVDNGPVAMVQADNARLYGDAGLERLKTVLRPGGQIAFWSASADRPFAQRLKRAGFHFEAVPTKAYPAAKRSYYVIYYAELPS